MFSTSSTPKYGNSNSINVELSPSPNIDSSDETNEKLRLSTVSDKII